MTNSVLVFVFTVLTTVTAAQSFESYVHSYCLQVAAFCAHPGLTFDQGKSNAKIFHKGFVLDLHYLEGINTILSVHLEDGIMTKTELNYDNHFFPPFATVSILESALGVQTAEVAEPVQKQIRRYYEKLYGTSTENFDGTQLTTAILSYCWANYVIEYDKTDLSGHIGTNQTPEVMRKIDGLVVKGSQVFVDRVIESLGIIKHYDSNFYNTYLAHSSGKYNVVRGITMNTRYSANTIDEGHFVALYSSHDYNPDNQHNPYYLASVIVHETAHLYQYSAYAQLFDCKVSHYLFSYSHDPVAIAKKEINAHKIQLGFLLKLPEETPWLENLKKRSRQFIKDYEVAKEAGFLMFDSRGPDCGAECIRQACRKIKPLYDKYGTAGLMDRLYELICIE